jgi:hypothetical protein
VRAVRKLLFLGLVASSSLGSRSSAAIAGEMNFGSLWELVEDAELIVLADVRGVRRKEAPPTAGLLRLMEEDATAELAIVEVWKGDASGLVAVPFSLDMICPAPPRYVVGKRVLAFLKEQTGQWTTVERSDGTLYPDDDETVDAFRGLVARARRIQSSTGSGDTFVEWLVAAAEHPGTRWHGLYPLTSPFNIFWDDDVRTIKYAFNSDQLDRIALAFVRSPSTDRALPIFLELISRHPYPGLDAAIARAIDAVLAEPEPPHWAADAVARALERWGDPLARKRRLDGACPRFVPAAELRALYRELWNKLVFPNALAPRSIGDGTPSNAPSGRPPP